MKETIQGFVKNRRGVSTYARKSINEQRINETVKAHMASISKNIIKIFTGTFFSRIFGFIREIVVGAYFGTGKVADAFTFALMFPNLFRQILGEDMVERAFMPPFKTIISEEDRWMVIHFLRTL